MKNTFTSDTVKTFAKAKKIHFHILAENVQQFGK
jgi:hypothetical protein